VAFKVIEYRQLIQILAMFMIVQFFGLLLAALTFSGATLQSIQSAALFSSYTSVLFYIAYIAVFSILLIIIFRLFNANKLFRILEAFVIFVSSFIVFATVLQVVPYGFMTQLYNLPFGLNAVIASIAAAALVAAKNRWQHLRNAAAMISACGVGLLFGVTFTFWIALLFMAVLAVYDFIAVFVTKHMLSLARIAETNNLALLIGVNEVEGLPPRSVGKEITDAYRKDKGASARFKKLIGSGLIPVAARIELGTGDLSMPLMVAVSAAGSTLNFVLSLFVVIGSIFGLLLTMFILRRYKRALPAIPPLLLGILVFVGLYFLLFA
jgi:presenilin-like A22 family membrane protease